MTIVRYTKEDRKRYTSKQVLDFIRSQLCNVEEIHCEESFTEQDVVDLCQILLRSPHQVNLRALHLPKNDLTIKSAASLAQVLSANTTITLLDVRHNALGPDGVELLIKPLLTSNNNTLKSLIIKDNKLSHRVASSVASMLRHNCETLSELHLGHNEVGVKGIKILAPVMGLGLQKLHLAHNHLKARGVKLLASALEGKDHHISFLDLTCNQMGPKGMHALLNWLMVHRDTTLEKLWLGSNDMGPNCGHMWSSILEFNSTLTEIRLGGNQLGDEGTTALSVGLSKNHSLTVLELDWNQVSDKGAESFSTALKASGTLRTVDLSGNQIGQAGCIALAQALPYSLELRELNMTNNMMNDEAANAFAESLTDRHCGFERLHWEGNPSLSQEGVKTLQHAVQYRKNSRTWLKPSFIQQVQSDRCGSINWMCKETISDFEVRKLASILLQSKGISRLTVFYLGGVDISAKGIKAIAEWIGSPGCSLKRFFVRNTSMGDEGAASIGDALESNTSLQELSLTGSHITAAGAASLGQSCAENETLTRLSLAYNHIGATGLLALARGVRLSKGLVSLNVMSNQIAIPKNSGIWDALSNSSIRELTLRDNAIDDDIIIDFVHSLRDQCPFRKLDFIDNQITDKGAWLLSKLLEEYHVQFFY